jgi:hypothetical protein
MIAMISLSTSAAKRLCVRVSVSDELKEKALLTSTEAVERFYHVGNCLYVPKHLRKKEAQTVMSRGVQLPDFLLVYRRRRHSASFTKSLRQYALSL